MGLPAPVTGATGGADRNAVLSAFSVFFLPGETRELRSLDPWGRAIVTGDDLEAASEAAISLPGNVYFSLNPILPGSPSASATTVLKRTWILFDVDPVRPAGVPSTDAEKARAGEVAWDVAERLSTLGWPSPVWADSGNGYHVYYRIDLPNDPLAHEIVKSCIVHMAKLCDTADAKVDRAVHDAPRICRLPGTWNRKGPDTPDRPHRMAKLDPPAEVATVTVDQLKALTAKPFKKPLAPVTAGGGIERYIASAIDRECARVDLAPPGERNVSLNRAAFALATMKSWPEFDWYDHGECASGRRSATQDQARDSR